MNTYHKIIACAAIVGILFYLIHQEIVVLAVGFPRYKQTEKSSQIQKKINLFVPHNQELRTETVSVIQSDNQQENLKTLVTAWCATLYDDKEGEQKIDVIHTFITDQGCVYITMSHNLFIPRRHSIQEKLLIIQGLVRSLKENGIPLVELCLLDQQGPYKDNHLDFSEAWNLTSCLGNN